MNSRETIASFDGFLSEQGLRWRAVVIGGTALNLLGVISRATKDCDVLSPMLTEGLVRAAKDFAREQRAVGKALADDWLNNGPRSLVDVLPGGWESRLQPLFEGASIHLETLHRLDLLRSKLFALCDRGVDLLDCVALQPTQEELAEILPWLEEQDSNPQWPRHVGNVLANLAEKLADGL